MQFEIFKALLFSATLPTKCGLGVLCKLWLQSVSVTFVKYKLQVSHHLNKRAKEY